MLNIFKKMEINKQDQTVTDDNVFDCNALFQNSIGLLGEKKTFVTVYSNKVSGYSGHYVEELFNN